VSSPTADARRDRVRGARRSREGQGRPDPNLARALRRAGAPVGVDVGRGRRPPLIAGAGALASCRACSNARLRDQTPHLVHVVGEPGVGKSRLTREFAPSIDDLPTDLVGTGPVLPYRRGQSRLGAQRDREVAMRRSLRTTGPDEAASKLTVPSRSSRKTGEREWIARGSGRSSGSVMRPPSVSAKSLRGVAGGASSKRSRRASLLLVIEDLHWASLDARVRGASSRLGERRPAVHPVHRPSRAVTNANLRGVGGSATTPPVSLSPTSRRRRRAADRRSARPNVLPRRALRATSRSGAWLAEPARGREPPCTAEEFMPTVLCEIGRLPASGRAQWFATGARAGN